MKGNRKPKKMHNLETNKKSESIPTSRATQKRITVEVQVEAPHGKYPKKRKDSGAKQRNKTEGGRSHTKKRVKAGATSEHRPQGEADGLSTACGSSKQRKARREDRSRKDSMRKRSRKKSHGRHGQNCLIISESRKRVAIASGTHSRNKDGSFTPIRPQRSPTRTNIARHQVNCKNHRGTGSGTPSRRMRAETRRGPRVRPTEE